MEALALAKQGFNSANAVSQTVRDLFARHMLSNVVASFGSLGASRMIVLPLRGGNHIRVAGEPVNSLPVILQQAVQTLFNDTFWNALKVRNGANNAQATRLDNARAALQPSIHAPSHRRLRLWQSPSTRRSSRFPDRHLPRRVPWRRGRLLRLGLGRAVGHCVRPWRHYARRSARSPSRLRPSRPYAPRCVTIGGKRLAHCHATRSPRRWMSG